MPKSVSEKQLAANRANAQKASRPKGKIGKEMIAARKAIRLTLQERCQKNELEHVETLEFIAKYSKNDSARINAINTLFDRGRGKATQPEHHTGAVSLRVITGVPEPDDDGDPPEPRTPYSPSLTIEHEPFPDPPVAPAPPPAAASRKEPVITDHMAHEAEPPPPEFERREAELQKQKRLKLDWSRG